MGLDSIDECVLVDRPGVRGALAEGVPLWLAASSEILPGDHPGRDKLDAVYRDQARHENRAVTLDGRHVPIKRPRACTDGESELLF